MEQLLFGRIKIILLNDVIDSYFSYNHRSINEDELKKIKDRIDNKIARRQQQTTKSAAPVTTISNPPPATTYSLPTPVINTTIPSFNNDEYSIFRDLPVSRPAATTVSLFWTYRALLFCFSSIRLNNNHKH